MVQVHAVPRWPSPPMGTGQGRDTMLTMSERQTARLWRQASAAWHATGPHAAREVFRQADALALWPLWFRTVTRRARRDYLSAIESVSAPRRAKITGEGRSQYPPRRIGALRRNGTRQSGLPGRVAKKDSHGISTV